MNKGEEDKVVEEESVVPARWMVNKSGLVSNYEGHADEEMERFLKSCGRVKAHREAEWWNYGFLDVFVFFQKVVFFRVFFGMENNCYIKNIRRWSVVVPVGVAIIS